VLVVGVTSVRERESEPLVCRTCIPQTKWHSSITIHAKRCDERSRELVGLFHLDLVITRIGVEE
jgi:hypothetical protein